MTAAGRRTAGAVLSLPVLTGVLLATPAEATTYAYWSYWHKRPGSSTWTYSGTGPYYYRPSDGSVEGWHFVHGSGGPSDPPPRASGSYARLCTTSTRAAGVQVALILDFGSSVRKACVTVPSGSNGSAVLVKAGARPHYDSTGLLCSISGYPAKGCGQVESGPASSAPAATPSSAPKTAGSTRTGGSSTSGTSGTGGTAAGETSAGGAGATTGGSKPPSTGSPSTAGSTAAAAGASATAPGEGATSGGPSDGPESFAPIASQGESGAGVPVGVLAGGAGILALAGAAVLRARRRRA